MDFMKDWKMWLIIAATLIALIAAPLVGVQHQNQSEQVMTQYQEDAQSTAKIVVVYGDNFEKAKQEVLAAYPDYSIVKTSYDEEKHTFYFRIIKKEVK